MTMAEQAFFVYAAQYINVQFLTTWVLNTDIFICETHNYEGVYWKRFSIQTHFHFLLRVQFPWSI